jgi:putative endonuclease
MNATMDEGSARCFVYVIGSHTSEGYRTYVGWTLDPDRRLREHNAGCGAKSTRGRTWHLLYLERFETRFAAMSREWHLKRDRRFRKLLVEHVSPVRRH